MKRIYLGGFIQETNTFCPNPTALADFERGYYLTAQQIPAKLGGTNTEIGGIYKFFANWSDTTIIPGLAAWAIPKGKITTDAFETICAQLLDSIEKNLSVDGVLLCLHGAMVSESGDDCEGELLTRVRRLIGNDIPVVCTLDYHAVVTETMAKNADLLIGYRTYPHVDFAATGQRAAQAIFKLLDEKPAVNTLLMRLSMILPVENTETVQGPLAGVMDRIAALDKDPKVISASFFCAQPWLDIESPALVIIIHTRNGSLDDYRRRAMEMVDYIWDHRRDFFQPAPGIKQVLENLSDYKKPVILVDSGDIITAGGLGDSTVILRSLLAGSNIPKTALTIVDPKTVKQAFEVELGTISQFCPGGMKDYGYNKRMPLQALVVWRSCEAVELHGPVFGGVKADMGRRVRLQINDRIDLMVCEYGSLIHEPQVLRSMGINPQDCDIIVQKSHKLFRAAYENIAKSIVAVDTPGFTDRNIARLPFERVHRPIYPLDKVDQLKLNVYSWTKKLH